MFSVRLPFAEDPTGGLSCRTTKKDAVAVFSSQIISTGVLKVKDGIIVIDMWISNSYFLFNLFLTPRALIHTTVGVLNLDGRP